MKYKKADAPASALEISPLSPVGDIPPFQGRVWKLRKHVYAVFVEAGLCSAQTSCRSLLPPLVKGGRTRLAISSWPRGGFPAQGRIPNPPWCLLHSHTYASPYTRRRPAPSCRPSAGTASPPRRCACALKAAFLCRTASGCAAACSTAAARRIAAV
jgi:hypothetical protein